MGLRTLPSPGSRGHLNPGGREEGNCGGGTGLAALAPQHPHPCSPVSRPGGSSSSPASSASCLSPSTPLAGKGRPGHSDFSTWLLPGIPWLTSWPPRRCQPRAVAPGSSPTDGPPLGRAGGGEEWGLCPLCLLPSPLAGPHHRTSSPRPRPACWLLVSISAVCP